VVGLPGKESNEGELPHDIHVPIVAVQCSRQSGNVNGAEKEKDRDEGDTKQSGRQVTRTTLYLGRCVKLVLGILGFA